jgi:hypothetical protein
VGGHGRRRLAGSTCAPASGRSTTSATRPWREIWVYAVSATPTKVYYAVWGSGVLEYDQKTGRWDKYDDPDGENEMVLFKDQGLIHEIVTSVSYVDNIRVGGDVLWRQPLRRPLLAQLPDQRQRASLELYQFVKGVDGNRAWFCTDKGLAYYDGVNWAVYRPR